MRKFAITDKHLNFAFAICAGERPAEAYRKNIANGKATKENTCKVAASKLLAVPEMQDLIAKTREERRVAITKAQTAIIEKEAAETAETLGPEFSGMTLTTDNIDQLHYSIAKGTVEMEAVYPTNRIEEIVNADGKVIKRVRTVVFQKVRRKPTIKERQASADALYKRFGNYAPTKGLFGFGNVNPSDDDPETPVERFVMLSTGEKIPF